MSWLDDLGKILQKPQSVYSGGLLGLERMMGQGGYDQSIEPDVGNILEGLLAGVQGNVRPHDVIQDMAPANEEMGIGRKILNTGADIGWDPLLALGPILKSGAAGAKAAELGEKAFSAGKLAEGASKADKLSTAAARATRRGYEGTLATGNPLTGLALGQLMGLGENQIAKLLPRLAGGVIKNAPELSDDLADSVGSAINLGDISGPPRAALGMGRAAEAAQRVGNEVPGSGEVITPEVVRRALGAGTPNQQAVGPLIPELGPSPASSMLQLGPATARAMPPGPRMFEGGAGGMQQVTPEDLFMQLFGRPSRSNEDNITKAFRMILEGQ